MITNRDSAVREHTDDGEELYLNGLIAIPRCSKSKIKLSALIGEAFQNRGYAVDYRGGTSLRVYSKRIDSKVIAVILDGCVRNLDGIELAEDSGLTRAIEAATASYAEASRARADKAQG